MKARGRKSGLKRVEKESSLIPQLQYSVSTWLVYFIEVLETFAKTYIKIFYLCINLGSLSSIATTELEKYTGFWTAFLLCLLMFIVGIVVIISGKKQYVVRPPKGSIIPKAFRALWIGLVNKGNMSMCGNFLVVNLALSTWH